jgi:hypothetical protein
MESAAHAQSMKLRALIRAAEACDVHAQRGMLFCSRAGLALVNAACAVFECDGLSELACDVARETNLDRDGRPLNGEDL